ncbi:MAG: hypothetical protein MJ097_00550 [Dorea sp.]|nr:hypothetical protein [Dorea sp.]
MDKIKVDGRILMNATDQQLVEANKKCNGYRFGCEGCLVEKDSSCRKRLLGEIARRFAKRVASDNVANEDLHG